MSWVLPRLYAACTNANSAHHSVLALLGCERGRWAMPMACVIVSTPRTPPLDNTPAASCVALSLSLLRSIFVRGTRLKRTQQSAQNLLFGLGLSRGVDVYVRYYSSMPLPPYAVIHTTAVQLSLATRIGASVELCST